MSAFDSDKYHRKWWLSLPRMRVTMAEALALPEYSATNPTGVRPGKTWRRHDGAFDHEARARGLRPRWVICTYEAIPGDDTRVRNGRYRAVIRVPMGRRVGPCTYPTCDCGVYMPDSILEGEQRALCPRDCDPQIPDYGRMMLLQGG